MRTTQTPSRPPQAPPAPHTTSRGCISGPSTDTVFLIAAPVVALSEKLLFAWTPVQHYLTYALLAGGVHFCICYCYAYWRFARQGYQVSYQKVALVVILAIVSMFSWGFDAFGGAFFIMNFFHVLQYFFRVWFVEKRQITSFFRLSRVPQGQTIALALCIFIGVGYGVWSQTRGSLHFPRYTMIYVLLVLSILHFWYDRFIWSVRKGQQQFQRQT